MNDKQVNRDNKAITNKKICSKVQATALRPRLHHREGFHYPLLDSPQGAYNKELQSLGVHNSPTQSSTPEAA